MVFLVSRDCCMALLAVPCVCLQFVIAAFPDHTRLLFCQFTPFLKDPVLDDATAVGVLL